MNDKIKIGVVGAGSMGAGIAQVAASNGHPVFLFDASSDALNNFSKKLDADLSRLVDKGKISADQKSQWTSNIQPVNNLESFADCGLIIEAIIEDLSIKKNLFSQLDQISKPECILATNTSSLPVVAIASACSLRVRVIGIHFFNPATLMPLVEIIPAFTTGEKTVQSSRSLIDSWGKVTVQAKDTPGFIVNRIARPFYGEALKIYEEGIADMSTIDHAVKTHGGFRMGPFELMDFIGNDINYKVTETVWEQMFYDPRYRPSLTQKRLYEAGLFGKKSGRGYYDYREGAVKADPDTDERKGRYIFERILVMLINEAADALYLGIASRDDIETAMTRGVNYPKGLLGWADEFGIGRVLEQLEKLQQDFGDDRYRPSLLLKKMKTEHRRFF
jgi:3-hydroxybutyryl-CoA dehydrogenase